MKLHVRGRKEALELLFTQMSIDKFISAISRPSSREALALKITMTIPVLPLLEGGRGEAVLWSGES